MKEIEKIKIIAQKIGVEYEKTRNIIDKKIGFYVDKNGHIIQLCMNNCNLMNETIPKEVWELVHLQVLCLSTNMISNFPEGVLKLNNLERLDLNGNQIRVITGKIKELKFLERLDLAGNQLETLPKDIGKLYNLKRLRLNTNRLRVLPVLDPSTEWCKLETIDLDGADLKELPTWIFSLKKLRCLSLSKLHLNRFPELVCKLLNLEELYIDSTHFLIWPNKIVLPKKMKCIILDGAILPKIHNTNICRLPDAIIELKPRYVRNQLSIEREDERFQVSLGGDISEGLDENLLFHSNPEVSYSYLKNLYTAAEEKKENNYGLVRLKDIKIVLLGGGAVGKSSLVQRLCLSDPDDDNIPLEPIETTHGVNIDYQLELDNIWDKTNKRYENFTARFWDFGGQDKYKSINKLLLTDKAIYIIVLDARAQSSPDIWLEMVKTYAPNSKIILVANKIDENFRHNINFQYYYEKYPQLYNCLFKISCQYQRLGINRISDILDAIRKIIEEQINIISPMGKQEWVKIQEEIENQYRLKNKELLSKKEYINICKSFGVDDINEQMQFLSILTMCGSCIAVEDEEFAILSPNWIADYLYLFYNQMPTEVKGIMDYKKEYIPMLNKLKGYVEYKELITDYLEERGLCTLFRDSTNRKKIFIPMFLSEEVECNSSLCDDSPILKYKFASSIIPEYEFHKFLVREFERIKENIYSIWQFGIYFRHNESNIRLQLMNDGIILEIWSESITESGNCLQWIRNAVINTTDENFFEEYILVEEKNRRTLLPYRTLEILNSWGIKLYCLPEDKNTKSFVLIDVESISRKCGLIKETLKEVVEDQDMRKEILKQDEKTMKVYIKQMGNINYYETHGKGSPICVNNSYKDAALMNEVNNLREKVDLNNEIYIELIDLLNELEKSNLKKRSLIRDRLKEWIANFANIATIGDTLYNNKEEIIAGVRFIISLLK